MAKQDYYELEVLLELRQQEREESEAQYAEALTSYHQAGQKVQARQEEYRQWVEERRLKCREFDKKVESAPGNMVDVQVFDRYLEGLQDREARALTRVEDAKAAQHRAQLQMRRAHDGMLKAIKELKAVEKHHEKWKEEKAVIERRRQAGEMDDVAARMWREEHR